MFYVTHQNIFSLMRLQKIVLAKMGLNCQSIHASIFVEMEEFLLNLVMMEILLMVTAVLPTAWLNQNINVDMEVVLLPLCASTSAGI